MSEKPTSIKLAEHLGSESRELADAEKKLQDAQQKDREVIKRLDNTIQHVDELRQLSSTLSNYFKEGSLNETLKPEHIEKLEKNAKGAVNEMEATKEVVQDILTEINLAEKELKDVVQKAGTDRRAIENL